MKINKSQFLEELKNSIRCEQYIFTSYSLSIEKVLETLKNITLDNLKHVSNNKRIIENVEIHSNYFKINNSRYDLNSSINIYKIKNDNCDYYILHKFITNNIVIYENIRKEVN